MTAGNGPCPSGTGFEAVEIDIVLDEAAEAKAPDRDIDDDLPALPDHGVAVTRPGELWQLGSHRLLCADATLESSYVALLDGAKASIIFTDPP